MVGQRRCDVLHGPYITLPRIAREDNTCSKGANVIDELTRIVRDIEGKSEMNTATLEELEEMAGKLLATARKLPPGHERHIILQEIGRFRTQIAALQGADLPARVGLKAKGK